MDIILFYRLLDLVDCFDLLSGMGGHDVASLCVPPGLSSRDLLQPSLSGTGVLDVAGVCFDVSGANSLCEGDSVRFGASLMMSDDTEDGDLVSLGNFRALTGRWLRQLWLAAVRDNSRIVREKPDFG